MEIWQHLLVLIISGCALFLGGAIATYTASEIKYAQKWLIAFNQLCALALIMIVLFVSSVAWYWYALVFVLFLGYIYKKSQLK